PGSHRGARTRVQSPNTCTRAESLPQSTPAVLRTSMQRSERTNMTEVLKSNQGTNLSAGRRGIHDGSLWRFGLSCALTLSAALSFTAVAHGAAARNPISTPGAAWAFDGFRVNIP